MLGYALCAIAFFACFIAGRRSHVAGLCAVMTVGYAYGIIRANVPVPIMHFIFDAGVGGLYAALFSRGVTPAQWARLKVLQPWMTLLIGWPIVLFFFPIQDPLVQLVGLRGQIYFLPFILIGAMLDSNDCYKLARWFAVLNIIAFGFALAEFVYGVPKFYPRNQNTTIIYLSNDILRNGSAFRIPATFINSAAYSGMMVGTTALLLGAWTERRTGAWNFYLLSAALIASGLGVFMGASRTQAMILLLMLGGAFVVGHLSLKVVLRSALALVCVAWVVSHDPRLQRFTQLDTSNVAGRISNSVNESFASALIDYPMGNGLGGGGTSMPFFLKDRLKNPVNIENEYAAILLEQGIPGLLIWAGFILWILTRPLPRRKAGWITTLQLIRIFLPIAFATACIGTGFFTSIPGSTLFFVFVGLYTTASVTDRPMQPARVPVTRIRADRASGMWPGIEEPTGAR